MDIKQFVNTNFFWYADISKINTDTPADRRWVLSKVLAYGTISDIKKLDYDEIKRELSNLTLPETVRRLWENYFKR